MSPYATREELENLVVTRIRTGWSARGLARSLKVSRNTVRAILEKHHQQRAEGHDQLARTPRAPRPSKLDEHVSKIKELLAEYPKITAQRIFEELTAGGYQGGQGLCML